MNKAKITTRLHRTLSAFLCVSSAGIGLSLTSCTTEEGILGGALAGAAIGGIVGSADEQNRRDRRRYYNDRYYRDGGYYRNGGYYNAPRGRAYYPARPRPQPFRY